MFDNDPSHYFIKTLPSLWAEYSQGSKQSTYTFYEYYGRDVVIYQSDLNLYVVLTDRRALYISDGTQGLHILNNNDNNYTGYWEMATSKIGACFH